ncbi:MAG: diaminopimelate epimerase [Nitrosomonadales bacterium]|nr:diaminopimelate epimerase [Nitrosomonadales bacterium]
MLLKFTKMHGAGNDFVVLDGVRQRIDLSPEQLRLLADRHFGVGCDQVLLVEKARHKDADFRYRIFNADGGEVEQCGNGARCFARFVHDRQLTQKREITVETQSGLIRPRLEDDGRVTVDMGAPIFDAKLIPFDGGSGAVSEQLEVAAMTRCCEASGAGMAASHPLPQSAGSASNVSRDVGETLQISALSMGNPHAVQVVADVEHAPVEKLGPLIERHPRFPERVNAGFMQVMDRHHIRLRVYERGSGETLSCGTGACAAAVAGIRRGLLDSPVNVSTRGGALTVAWGGEGQPVLMTGPAITVFEGEIIL